MNAPSTLVRFALLCLLAFGCSKKDDDETGPVDFVKLTAQAYPSGGQRNNEKTEKLWLEVNKLAQWHFTTTKDLVAQKQPSLELVEGGSWLIASTDLEIARAYAQARGRALAQPPSAANDLPPSALDVNGPAPSMPDAAGAAPKPNPYAGDDGAPLVVTMTPDQAVAYLQSYSGPPLAGVRFNEGANRTFFGDVGAIVRIRTKLKEKGRLAAAP